MVNAVRAVMVTTPPLLGDLVKQLVEDRVEVTVIADFASRRALARRLSTLRPDLVVIGLRRGESERVVRSLLALLPAAKVIALWPERRYPLGFELRLHRRAFADASPDDLVDFILGDPDRRRTS